ncbi:co-chaperone YbbN [Acaryochloris marina]|uniref:thioredoxin family protein n=1 Tax=Acaryochloris marina TaxID=155978 RepID=UPI001BAFC2D6|nr:thioredoxin domain-containing protein [Acaryochloris marina]QUY42169.1 thiol reductase thioredoxin [Acaryochloris marina S15]
MLPAIQTRTFAPEVLQSETAVLVNFWAPWCGVCRWVEPLLIQVQADYDSELKVVAVNADENFAIASQYRLTNIPSLLLFHQGRLVHRMDHFCDRTEALRLLEAALDQIVPSRLSAG